VTKYAGGVVKGFALIAGIAVTAVVQWALFGQPLTWIDFGAIGLVSFAIYLHSSFPIKRQNLNIRPIDKGYVSSEITKQTRPLTPIRGGNSKPDLSFASKKT
jgi:hypothetical protein